MKQAKIFANIYAYYFEMKIEKSSYIEIYNVETDKYNISIQYRQYYNILFSEWEVLSIQDKHGLEVELEKNDLEQLKDGIIPKIVEIYP